MEEAPENGKEPSNSAHANGMNESPNYFLSLVLSSARLNVHDHANFDHLETILKH